MTVSGVGAFLGKLPRQIWFRTSSYTLAAVVLALAAGIIGPLLPWRPSMDLGQDALSSLLQILASSMLAVTTFSLTAMVTALSSATSNATPRSTQLFAEDPTSQDALSTFLGAFMFALVGIVALATGYYGEQGRTILFLGTLVVIALIVVTLLRWVSHLIRFGRLSDAIDRVESAACAAARTWARSPTLGAVNDGDTLPRGRAVVPDATGYVTRVDVAGLQRIAEDHDLVIHVLGTAGRRVGPVHPVAVVTGGSLPDGADEVDAHVRAAFGVEPHRSFDQDPRLGFIALAEIGSRALSPATNDPGTAIEVLAALERVFVTLLTTEPDDSAAHDRVRIRPLDLDALVVDGFRPIARDGSDVVEVQLRMQKSLALLATVAGARGRPFRVAAEDAFRRTDDALDAADRELVAGLRASLRWDADAPPSWEDPPPRVAPRS